MADWRDDLKHGDKVVLRNGAIVTILVRRVTRRPGPRSQPRRVLFRVRYPNADTWSEIDADEIVGRSVDVATDEHD